MHNSIPKSSNVRMDREQDDHVSVGTSSPKRKDFTKIPYMMFIEDLFGKGGDS